MMNKPSIDHVGIATKSIEEATVFWDALGLVTESDHVNHEQGVRIRMLEGGPGGGGPFLEYPRRRPRKNGYVVLTEAGRDHLDKLSLNR